MTGNGDDRGAETMDHRGWVVDLIVGGGVGLASGLIVAVNLVVYAGPDEGYTATPAEVFDQRPAVGVAALAALVAGPTFGVLLARRVRRGARSGRR